MFSLTSLLVVAYASSHCMARSTSRPISARANYENVVLADCTGATNTSDQASEVAYFPGSPDSAPKDTASVTTGQLHTWANATTSAYFTDTSTRFVAVLNQRGNAGDYAGTANNGYGNFSCYQTDSTFVYSHDDRNCFMVYDCNHQQGAVSVTSATPSASATASSASATATSSTRSGLSVGAVVGLSIGVAASAIIIAAVAVLLVWRHRRSSKQAAAAAALQEKGTRSGVPGAPDVPKGPSPVNAIWQGPGVREMETPEVYHELHSQERPTEIHGEALRGELDATATRSELHSYDLPPRYDHETVVNPGAYGNFKGPV
ncbi:hypothetical protein F4804DRAFT_337626 [Jackrogersella minutella]|nr:hypothetical protein F4804DRAFT_337626 [Jackrogersella minutella]